MAEGKVVARANYVLETGGDMLPNPLFQNGLLSEVTGALALLNQRIEDDEELDPPPITVRRLLATSEEFSDSDSDESNTDSCSTLTATPPNSYDMMIDKAESGDEKIMKNGCIDKEEMPSTPRRHKKGKDNMILPLENTSPTRKVLLWGTNTSMGQKINSGKDEKIPFEYKTVEEATSPHKAAKGEKTYRVAPKESELRSLLRLAANLNINMSKLNKSFGDCQREMQKFTQKKRYKKWPEANPPSMLELPVVLKNIKMEVNASQAPISFDIPPENIIKIKQEPVEEYSQFHGCPDAFNSFQHMESSAFPESSNGNISISKGDSNSHPFNSTLSNVKKELSAESSQIRGRGRLPHFSYHHPIMTQIKQEPADNDNMSREGIMLLAAALERQEKAEIECSDSGRSTGDADSPYYLPDDHENVGIQRISKHQHSQGSTSNSSQSLDDRHYFGGNDVRRSGKKFILPHPPGSDTSSASETFEVEMKAVKVKKTRRARKTKQPLPCTYCGKLFNNQSSLRQHESFHRPDRPFNCGSKGCDKAYKTRSELNRHLVVHSGEKKHFCKLCGKRFLRKQYLKTHLIRHHETGITMVTPASISANGIEGKSARPLVPVVTVAPSSFVSKTEPLTWRCQLCHRIFVTKDDLKKHTRSYHSKKRRPIEKK